MKTLLIMSLNLKWVFKWLDEQPRGIVLFVCFGSIGTHSSAQTDELAFGLEMSEQKILMGFEVS
jgi:hydroquinone glucosyltransferase